MLMNVQNATVRQSPGGGDPGVLFISDTLSLCFVLAHVSDLYPLFGSVTSFTINIVNISVLLIVFYLGLSLCQTHSVSLHFCLFLRGLF